VKQILMLLVLVGCMFSVGDKVYLLSKERPIGICDYPSVVSDVYINKKGECVYQVQIYGNKTVQDTWLVREEDMHLWTEEE